MKSLEKLLSKLKAKKGKHYVRNSKINVIQNKTSDYNNYELVYSSEEEDSPISPKEFIKKIDKFKFPNELKDFDNRSCEFKFGVKCENSDLLWSRKTRMRIVRLNEPAEIIADSNKVIPSKADSSTVLTNNVETDTAPCATPILDMETDILDTGSSTAQLTKTAQEESLSKETTEVDSKPVDISHESIVKENNLDSKPVLEIKQESIHKESTLVDLKPVQDNKQESISKQITLADSKSVLDTTHESVSTENTLLESKPVLIPTQPTPLKKLNPSSDSTIKTPTTESSLPASSISIKHQLIDGKNTVKIQQKSSDIQPSNVVISLPSSVPTTASTGLTSSLSYLSKIKPNPLSIITNGTLGKISTSILQNKPLTNSSTVSSTSTTLGASSKKTLTLSNNNMLIQALAAAGIKSVDGKILAFRATNGNYIIKTSSTKGVSIPSLQLSSIASNIGKVQAINQAQQPGIGLSQVTPKTTSILPIAPKIIGNVTKNKTGIDIQTPKASVQNYTSAFLAGVESKIRTDRQKKYESPSALIKGQKMRISSSRNGVKSIFMLSKHELRELARNAGLKEVKRGFLYNSKVSTTWPELIPRPTISVVWRYRLSEARHLACVGLMFRLFHASLKWNLINEKAPKGAKRVITSNKGLISVHMLLLFVCFFKLF